MDYKAIGESIKSFRKTKQLTQAQLGEKIGRTESSIAKYEKGIVEIPMSVLKEIANILDIPLFVLIKDEFSLEKNEGSLIEYLFNLGYDFSGIPCQLDGEIVPINGLGPYTFFANLKDNGIYAVESKEILNSFKSIDTFIAFTMEQLIKRSLNQNEIKELINSYAKQNSEED